MKPIKKRLLVSLMGTLFFMGAIMVGVTYFELKEEMDEVFDGSIQQIAETIAVYGVSGDDVLHAENISNHKTRKGEEEFLVQIWKDDALYYTSHAETVFPRQGEGGVRTVLVEGEKWRYFGTAQGDLLIQVSQPIHERHLLIWEIYAELLTPMLILIPIMGGMIWFFVGVGFRPLTRVSKLIEERSSTFL